jgi:hypothetical protein
MSSGWRVAVTGLVAAAVALASAGAASADNSNNNANTNDVTSIGNPSLGNTSGSEKTNWPPTDLGWPPKEIMSGADNENVGNSGNKGNDNSAATPIVMPVGQAPPAPTAGPSTTETPKPIVPVSSP